MPERRPRYSAEETARRGDELYERQIRAQVEAGNHGKVVAIDVDTGAYTVDSTALAAARRLQAEHPEAEIWFVRIGHSAIHRIAAPLPCVRGGNPWGVTLASKGIGGAPRRAAGMR